ncbi:hypothetical protein MBM_06506 [Drepanopeziza brunnea f. sp. 'multigermtubi' MB_m1]|uniref:Uncharacterized protein n=1 Tax=Marssonina brunnea f. sp. multigermtubi (strain MB_m1) TaxID=1072389 RepID=K1WD22_MARBU|nr:uncharacterized protein MBM_06506 [Drepanopeziza brunnea f. sp. 'multigermtubi' MB_m1]EKD15290.1 hypothetical protein MBM_06506 [Drepanopeziza brunnea f. sp. 'multigermtubi' MB_m1]
MAHRMNLIPGVGCRYRSIYKLGRQGRDEALEGSRVYRIQEARKSFGDQAGLLNPKKRHLRVRSKFNSTQLDFKPKESTTANPATSNLITDLTQIKNMHHLLVALVAMLPAALAAALPDLNEDINITITFSDEDLGMPFAPITATCAGDYECPGTDVCRNKRCASAGGRMEKAAAEEEDAAQAVFTPASPSPPPPLTSNLHDKADGYVQTARPRDSAWEGCKDGCCVDKDEASFSEGPDI